MVTAKYCVDCQHFKDARLHPVYITPRCTVRGDDDCSFMRAHVCGIEDAGLYESNKEITTEIGYGEPKN